MNMKSTIAAAVVAGAFAASGASAATIVLDFEDVNATYPSGYAFVEDYYNGGTSTTEEPAAMERAEPTTVSRFLRTPRQSA
ncbi:MAG: hypothetical protein JXR75_14620 [Rhodobacteraceae bacterium]|nr:hypothetical protein [Paracoccaceae bacterium]